MVKEALKFNYGDFCKLGSLLGSLSQAFRTILGPGKGPCFRELPIIVGCWDIGAE